MKFRISNLKFLTKENFPIVFILGISAFLRLYRIQDYMTFLGDEGRDVLIVYGILHGKLTLLGPTASVGGFFLGPIYYYLMAPFLWLFNYNPVGPAIMVALFGIATVFLIYVFAKEFFNQTVALVASILYSISPLVISYSRSSWNPNIFPFFSVSTLYILYKAIKNNNIKLFFLSGFLLGISMQLHYLAFFLGGIVFIYILITNFAFTKLNVRSTLDYLRKNLTVFLGFVVGLSPFLAFEARHDFSNIRSIINFALNSGDTGAGSALTKNISDVFFRLFARLVANYPPPEQVAPSQHLNIFVWNYFALALAVVSLTILTYRLIKSFGKNEKSKAEFLKFLLLATWFVLGIGLFGFYKKPIYDYYFGFMFPLPFILVGMSFDYLFKRTLFLKIVAVFGLLSLIVLNLNGIPFRSTPNRQYMQVKLISEFVLDKVDNKPYNFALITGGNSDHAYRYFFTLEGKSPTTILSPSVDPQRNSVTDQLLIVCEDISCKPLGNSLWEVAGFGRADIESQWDVSVVKVYKLIHYKGK